MPSFSQKIEMSFTTDGEKVLELDNLLENMRHVGPDAVDLLRLKEWEGSDYEDKVI